MEKGCALFSPGSLRDSALPGRKQIRKQGISGYEALTGIANGNMVVLSLIQVKRMRRQGV
jgi:hypothetical protein